MLKICNYIYIVRFLTSSSIQSSKNKLHQLTFKSKFYLFVKSETFIKFNTSCYIKLKLLITSFTLPVIQTSPIKRLLLSYLSPIISSRHTLKIYMLNIEKNT